jgi:hypothetical protein
MPLPSFLIPAAASLIGGMFRGGNQTQRTNQQTFQTSSTQGNTSSRRYLSDGQQQVMGDVGGYIRTLLTNPNGAVAPARTASLNRVNDTYLGAENILRGRSSVAGGRSGRAGRAMRELQSARLGHINDTNLGWDQKALDLQQLAGQMGLNFANINLGQDGTFSTNAQSQGTMNGFATGSQPGGPWGQGVGSALETIAAILSLQKMIGGGGNLPGRGGQNLPAGVHID